MCHSPEHLQLSLCEIYNDAVLWRIGLNLHQPLFILSHSKWITAVCMMTLALYICLYRYIIPLSSYRHFYALYYYINRMDFSSWCLPNMIHYLFSSVIVCIPLVVKTCFLIDLLVHINKNGQRSPPVSIGSKTGNLVNSIFILEKHLV